MVFGSYRDHKLCIGRDSVYPRLTANNELLAGIDQVTQAMESIKAAGEQNVAGMKDLEAASGGLKEMGQKLSLLIERYTV